MNADGDQDSTLSKAGPRSYTAQGRADNKNQGAAQRAG